MKSVPRKQGKFINTKGIENKLEELISNSDVLTYLMQDTAEKTCTVAVTWMYYKIKLTMLIET